MMMSNQISCLAVLSLIIFITCRLKPTVGFIPNHKSLASSITVQKRSRHQLEQQRSSDERQSASSSPQNTPFFLQTLGEEQQQKQEELQREQSDGWNTAQSNGYTQQMDDEYIGDTSAVNAQYQSQQEEYYNYQQQPPQSPPPPPTAAAAADQSSQFQTSSSTQQQQASSSQDGGISSVDARVLESILAEGKLDLNTEDEVKKLLEGPRMTEEYYGAGNVEDSGESSKYSSKVISVSNVTFVLFIIHFLLSNHEDVLTHEHNVRLVFSFSPFRTTNFGIVSEPRDLN